MTVPITPEAAEEFRQLMQDPASRAAFVAVKQQHAKEGVHVRYNHILEAMLATPWAIYPPYMEFLADLVMDRVVGVRLSEQEVAERLEAARRPSRPDPPEGVAVIPIHGPIVPKGSFFADVSGATSIQALRAAFREALAAKDVSTIVLDIDSPGGNVQGVPEMAQEIRAARGRKPIISVADGLMASAAYHLGSQADEIVASKSALLGSIGVITAHADLTKAAEQAGVKVSLISAGKWKTLGHPMEPLTDEGHARVQATVDEFYNMFVGDVARARGVRADDVRNGFGEGDIVTAREAVKLNMADRIGTLEEVVGEHLSKGVQAVVAVPIRGLTTSTAAIDAGGRGEASDDSEWDGNEVMTRGSNSENPAAFFRAVSGIERTEGEPNERRHWALPHHKDPGRPANAAAIRNARARFAQTQGLKDREAARRHIFQTHRLPGESEEEAGVLWDLGSHRPLVEAPSVSDDKLSAPDDEEPKEDTQVSDKVRAWKLKRGLYKHYSR